MVEDSKHNIILQKITHLLFLSFDLFLMPQLDEK